MAVALGLGFAQPPVAPARAHGKISRLISLDGSPLCRVSRQGNDLAFPDDPSGELWVIRNRDRVWAGLTHYQVGGAVPSGAGRWKIWSGRKLVGGVRVTGTRLAVIRVAREFTSPGYGFHADHLRTGLLGYASGPDALAAATAYALLDTCS